ncbi:hypothetical protein [Curtobacterium sp. MEB011]|uniref:hypothetical protein n=1 Tax=Curtobacterium sp. MEB011 TaxID=3040285 RepID=UPI00254D4574|nr:hypothetical protein [Curtobacterium sp. MEB011]
MRLATLTVEEPGSCLGLSAANFQKVVGRGDLRVEYTDAGDRVMEEAMADFRQSQRERKLRGMEQITALSDEMGFTE